MDISVDSTNDVVVPALTGKLQLAQLAKLLRPYLWLIVTCCLLGAGVAYALAATMPKSYTAYSQVAVEGERFAIPELEGALRSENAPDPIPWVLTEVQALSARVLVQGVVNKLHLDKDPEFNPALRSRTASQQLKHWLESVLPATLGTKTIATGLNEAVLRAVTRMLVISQDNRSLVIGVSFTARDPKLAADFVNTLIGDYIASRASRRASATQSANAVLAQRIDQARNDLNEVEQQIRYVRSKNEVVGLRAGSVGQQQLEDLATAAARATLERSQLEETLARANALAKEGSSDALASVLESPTISRLRDQESQVSARVADLSSRYGSAYPGLRSVEADLAATRKQIAGETHRIVASLDAKLRVARAHEADVQEQLSQARTAAAQGQNAQAQLDQLREEAATRRTLYQTLLERAQRTVAQPSGTETPDVRVLSPAIPPGLPSAPNAKMAGGLGGFAGGVLGCLLALTRVRSLDRFAGAAELAKSTSLPVVMSLPTRLRQGGRRSLAKSVVLAPAGPEAEAMRVLRERLRKSLRSGVARSIAFASSADTAAGGAGTADFAAAFARVAALDGNKVLLFEGNLLSADLGRLLGAPPSDLAAILRDDADWRDWLAPDRQTPTLDLLLADAAGPVDAHAALSGTRFQNLLIEATDHFDLIVINAPPASDTGALTLARLVDSTVVVVDGRRAKREATRAMASGLGAMSRNPVLAVLVGSA